MDPRRRTLTLLVVLCLGHVLLISSQVPTSTGSSVLYASTFGGMARLQGLVAAFGDGIGGLWNNYIRLGSVARENEDLRRRALELEGQLQGEKARGERVDGLEAALSLQRSTVAPTLAARVIAGNLTPGVLTVNLDRGTADGVTANMAVISGGGIVGRIIGSPSARASTVQLLIDRSASAGAILEGSGTAGAVFGGQADGLLRVDLISSTTVVNVGERVVTSGQDGIFPQGFTIGTVAQVTGAGKTREVLVQPAVNFARLDVVLIVLARPASGLDPQK